MVLQMDPCARLERWLTPYADGELDAIHILEVDDHLERCEECAERVAMMKAMRTSLRKVAKQQAPSALRERIRAALLERAAREDGEGVEASDGFNTFDDRAAADAVDSVRDRDALGHDVAITAVSAVDGVDSFDDRAASFKDNVRQLPQRDTDDDEPALLSAQAARTPRLVPLRYVFPLAAAAVFALVLVGVRQSEEPAARLGGQALETSQQRADGAPGEELAAADVRPDSEGAEPDAVPVPGRGLDLRRVATHSTDRARQSDAHDDGPRELLDPNGVSTDGAGSEDDSTNSSAASDPLRVASAQDVQPQWAGLALPPGQNIRVPSFATLDTLIEDLVEHHVEPLPPETTDPKGLERFDRFVGVRVARPRYEPFGARYVGARLHPINGSRTAMLQYVMGNSHRVTLYVFDSQRTPMRGRTLKLRPLNAQSSQNGQRAYVGQLRGYNVAASENAGVGYALATDLDADESAKLVLAAAKQR